jgi:hypothetical protein
VAGEWFPHFPAIAQISLSLPSSDLIAVVLNGRTLSQSCNACYASKSVCVSVTKTFVLFRLCELMGQDRADCTACCVTAVQDRADCTACCVSQLFRTMQTALHVVCHSCSGPCRLHCMLCHSCSGPCRLHCMLSAVSHKLTICDQTVF